MGYSLLEKFHQQLQLREHLIIAGCFPDGGMAWMISGDGNLPSTQHKYQTNAEEADRRKWPHKNKCVHTELFCTHPTLMCITACRSCQR